MNNTSGGGYTPSSPKKPQGETPVNKTRVREQLGQFPYDSQIYKSLTQNGAVYEGGGWWNFYPENRSRLKTIIATTKNGNKGKSFATGGYTGEWSNGDTEGRVAMLHQKELVLNKTDTENMLAAVQAIRDFSPELITLVKSLLNQRKMLILMQISLECVMRLRLKRLLNLWFKPQHNVLISIQNNLMGWV